MYISTGAAKGKRKKRSLLHGKFKRGSLKSRSRELKKNAGPLTPRGEWVPRGKKGPE